MNDVDIMRDMERCVKADCANCDRSHTEFCAVNLMKDALVIMKMQHDALKGFSEELEKLKRENALLKTTARFSFDEPKLVRAVNNIIRDVYAASDEGSGEDDYLQMIDTMLMFCKMLPSKYHVLITGFKSAPELVKR